MQPVYKTGFVTMFALDYDFYIRSKQADTKPALLELFQQTMQKYGQHHIVIWQEIRLTFGSKGLWL